MKDIITKINESQSINIELSTPEELYDILNALYNNYNTLKHGSGDDRYYIKGYEKLYDKIIKCAKKSGVKLDKDYDGQLSKIRI